MHSPQRFRRIPSLEFACAEISIAASVLRVLYCAGYPTRLREVLAFANRRYRLNSPAAAIQILSRRTSSTNK